MVDDTQSERYFLTMTPDRIYNVNIVSETLLPTPRDIKNLAPAGPEVQRNVYEFRERIRRILDRKDRRLLGVVGPCSIHNIDSALEYARRLKSLSDEVKEDIFIVMRVYFEKPRTSVGWKGFINDPYLDDSFRIDEGLRMAREFLVQLAETGLPAGTEAVDPITPQYIGDLISWTAIGARTTESQTHREMASGLSTPVGFKNATSGNMDIAVNALKSSANSHHFLGITQDGASAVFHTKGNRYGHVILRGGTEPNHDAESVSACAEAVSAAGFPANIVIDCSHGNSGGDPARQPAVLDSCIKQVVSGNDAIRGFMIESNLEEGRQVFSDDSSKLDPGVSITDPCVDWPTTVKMLKNAAEKLSAYRGS
ncbi:MAG: 3-deoxy-7-phosphoheptulonate synthase [Kiritimatiellia bacterium]